ncbi:MAG TPA: DNA topoisomerase VI subunit B [Planctomycetota bacterium]|nr:DNA topoisomerase VI subunit B [Planctomycetota bacterium]
MTENPLMHDEGAARAATEAPSPEPVAAGARPRGAKGAPRAVETAESMAVRQREISISEFFAKNRHLLGFDSPRKALLTTVKEAVDNSLDACEEAGLLPELYVELQPVPGEEDRYRVVVEDNGPGIVKAQIGKIFGKLLYGSKFHRLRQSRGQQGIGISAAGMYGQLTTGEPMVITSRTGKGRPAIRVEMRLDTLKNQPEILKEQELDWDRERGTRVEIELAGKYLKGRQSVDEYLALTAVANPHCEIAYKPPTEDVVIYRRATTEMPAEPQEILPHPHGVELGVLIKLLKTSQARRLSAALKECFCRVSDKVADEFCRAAKLSPDAKPGAIAVREADALYKAIQTVKVLAPPVDCLVPVGQDLILEGMKKEVDADFFAAITRPPKVYRGNPFLIEVGIALGGNLPADDLARVMRFANRVPLQYQPGACAITKAVMSVDWKNYGLQQSKGALPTGPVVILVHVASVWVPFTSESKEAIASYDEIVSEMRLGLMECGRKLGIFLNRRKREADELKKRSYIDKYIPQIGIALQDILNLADAKRDEATASLKDVLERSRKP